MAKIKKDSEFVNFEMRQLQVHLDNANDAFDKGDKETCHQELNIIMDYTRDLVDIFENEDRIEDRKELLDKLKNWTKKKAEA